MRLLGAGGLETLKWHLAQAWQRNSATVPFSGIIQGERDLTRQQQPWPHRSLLPQLDRNDRMGKVL